MTSRPRARVPVKYTLWAKHGNVRSGWLRLLTGLTQEQAVNEVVTRQDRVRRSGEPVRFTVAIDGKRPDE